jgi:hypothetical protein
MAATTVDSYVAAVPSTLLAIAATLQEMLSAELASDGTLWHGHPVWKIAGAPVAGFKVFPSHVTFMIWRGSEIDDPSGRLRPSGSRGMASVTVADVGGIDGALFAEWLRQADDLEISPALLAG